MMVTVMGADLPGRRCGEHENVHVGLCDRSWTGPPTIQPARPWGVTGLVAGVARTATWELEIVVKEIEGALDFGGRAVRGNRGDCHIGLAWGAMPDADTFLLFRVAKLRLDAVDPAAVHEATQPGNQLTARLGLTDGKGEPRSASVRPPDIAWVAVANG